MVNLKDRILFPWCLWGTSKHS